ncbi:MAG: SDR family oxidoreductase [Bacteroidota bacterium]
MKKTALITGASNGIGLELAKVHAAQGGDLILAARSIQKLNELKLDLEKKHNINVMCVEIDLSKPNASIMLYDEIKKQNVKVDYLINNAGFGDFGLFHEADQDKMMQMIQLNISALTQLTRLYLPEMVKDGKGKIMNVASAAAFQPGPTMAVYYATKAYVLHLTEAISNEIENTGVSITALCPGATISGFKDAADLQESKLFKNKSLPTSKEVAEYGYEQMLKGKVVAIHGMMNFLMANSVRFAPRSLVLKIVRMIQDK